MNIHSPGRAVPVLFPIQLARLAELFPEGGAVAIFQEGSTITAYNGRKRVTLNASGKILKDHDPEPNSPC